MTASRGRRARAVPGLLAAAVLLGAAGCDRAAPTPPPAAVAPAPAADDASRELLDRLVRAERTTAYQGFRVVSYGPEGESRESRFRVAAAGDGRTLVAWSGGDGDGPRARRSWSADGRFPWVARPELLLRNYTVALGDGPGAPVAFRDTRRVRVAGRLPGRPSVELLVDAETWLVLAETWRTPGGEEWYRARFESIAYGPPDAASGDASPEPVARAAAGAAPPAGWSPLTVGALPEGFVAAGGRTSACGAWVEDFTDGLAGLSVLQRPAGGDAPPPRELRRHRWLGGLALSARVGDVSATVQGGLGEDALRQVLDGLRSASPAR